MKFTLDIEIDEKDTDKCTKEDVYSEIVSFLRHCEVSSNVTLRSGVELPPMTVKEAIERKIIDCPFALKGSYSGNMYFCSWKNKISKMSKEISDLELSSNYDSEKNLDRSSYNIEPKVRLVQRSFSDKPYLEPYALVWVSDYNLVVKK
jgi:hypothetical protein